MLEEKDREVIKKIVREELQDCILKLLESFRASLKEAVNIEIEKRIKKVLEK